MGIEGAIGAEPRALLRSDDARRGPEAEEIWTAIFFPLCDGQFGFLSPDEFDWRWKSIEKEKRFL